MFFVLRHEDQLKLACGNIARIDEKIKQKPTDSYALAKQEAEIQADR